MKIKWSPTRASEMKVLDVPNQANIAICTRCLFGEDSFNAFAIDVTRLSLHKVMHDDGSCIASSTSYSIACCLR